MKKVFLASVLIVILLCSTSCISKHKADIVVDNIYVSANYMSRGVKHKYYQMFSTEVDDIAKKNKEDKTLKKAILEKVTEILNNWRLTFSQRILYCSSFMKDVKRRGIEIPEAKELMTESFESEVSSLSFEELISLCDRLKGGEDFKEIIDKVIKDKCDEVYDDSPSESDVEFFVTAVINKNSSSDYYDISKIIPEKSVIDYFTSYGTLANTTKGQGYYADKTNTDESGTVSPLGTGGGVGSYTSSRKEYYIGDFYLKVTSKKWYGTDSSDPNNSIDSVVNFKGKYISGKSGGKSLYDDLTGSRTYYIESNSEYVFAIIKNGHVTLEYFQK